MAAEGVANEEIARSCGVTSDTVRRWRSRFVQSGLAGIGLVAKGRGRRTTLTAATIAEVLRLTLHEKPGHGATVWSTRTMAAQVGIGKDAVARIWVSTISNRKGIGFESRKAPVMDRTEEETRSCCSTHCCAGTVSRFTGWSMPSSLCKASLPRVGLGCWPGVLSLPFSIRSSPPPMTMPAPACGWELSSACSKHCVRCRPGWVVSSETVPTSCQSNVRPQPSCACPRMRC